ncbi:MAG: Bax inhibitor-1/YccA family protein [Methylacidiphilales bacterium]|nr:Bax inhibitor-1/YccA family protein [Candidatus Methylacidiphilales bacterium]
MQYKPEATISHMLFSTHEDIVKAFITRVYGWMAIAMILTGVAAVLTASNPEIIELIFENNLAFISILLAQAIMVIVLDLRMNKLSLSSAIILFVLYSILVGISLSILFYIYTQESIALVFFVTAATFAVASIYGMLTKADLTRVGHLAFMALFGIIIGSFVNLFFNNDMIYWILTYLSVIVFVLIIAYKTKEIKNMAYQMSEEGELCNKSAIFGALSLYLTFLNLLFSILRILGRRRSNV